MIKVTLLGAGSGFTQPLFTDILNVKGIDRGIIGLVDIDRRRLDVNVRLMRRLLELMKKDRWRIEASTDRKDVLKGTDYLVNTIEVSGMECVRHDIDIPRKYGIDQCVGDTIGPGGVMKALRTVPVWIDILRDAARLCPNALILNYTNPMSIMSLATVRTTDQRYIGLCHSVQGTSRQLAGYANIPHDELSFRCGGINHMSWFTQLRWRNRDVYPVLHAAMKHPKIYKKDRVRFEIMKEFDFFVTESSGHFSEYVPYFRKGKLLEKYAKTGFYADFWPLWRKEVDSERQKMAAGKKKIETRRSYEYAADIIEAHHLGRKKVIYGSVSNKGLITNLPQNGVVEVAVRIDKKGLSSEHFGELPEHLAALCRSNMAVFELCTQGILRKDREAIVHAMMLDPLSAAICSLPEIRRMAEELFKAEKSFIPQWCNGQEKRIPEVKYKYNPDSRCTGESSSSAIAERVVREMERNSRLRSSKPRKKP